MQRYRQVLLNLQVWQLRWPNSKNWTRQAAMLTTVHCNCIHVKQLLSLTQFLKTNQIASTVKQSSAFHNSIPTNTVSTSYLFAFSFLKISLYKKRLLRNSLCHPRIPWAEFDTTEFLRVHQGQIIGSRFLQATWQPKQKHWNTEDVEVNLKFRLYAGHRMSQ